MRKENENLPRTVVMGAGNILMKDDGIGVHVVQALQDKRGLPGDIEIIDAGTAALDILCLLDGVDRLIIIDAVRGGGETGTIYKLSPDDIREKPRGSISLHQMSLLQALSSNTLLGSVPAEVVIIGVEPGEIGAGMELTPELRDRIPMIIETVESLL